MTAIKIIFWISLFIIGYSYIGYGILLFILVRIKRMFVKPPVLTKATYEPLVSLVVAAYNEEDFIEAKMHNTLQLDYPQEKLEVVFITDGSTDSTPDIISRNK